ncbi:hypothetical protein QEZ54_18575 [Catellatospora sp. KI3]|nr:hypothetical protein [Catellatospora sp. KI3]MDI1462986.1 hypothetical protein [Catellatospora sp. KI3]
MYEIINAAGSVASVIAMLLAIPAAIALFRRRRRRNSNTQQQD